MFSQSLLYFSVNGFRPAKVETSDLLDPTCGDFTLKSCVIFWKIHPKSLAVEASLALLLPIVVRGLKVTDVDLGVSLLRFLQVQGWLD